MLCDFTKEELDLLAHGFGFFVQEFSFNMKDDDSAHLLLTKLFSLGEEARSDNAAPDAP